jgi:hypothetical protein
MMLKRNGYGVIVQRNEAKGERRGGEVRRAARWAKPSLVCWRATLMVLESSGYGVTEEGRGD